MTGHDTLNPQERLDTQERLDSQKRLEQEIDEALRTLRDTQPLPGLEARVLARVQQRQEQASRHPAQPWLPGWPAAIPLAAFSAVLCAAAGLLWHHTATPPAPTDQHVDRLLELPMAQPVQSTLQFTPAIHESAHATPAISRLHLHTPKGSPPETPEPIAASFLPSIAPPPPRLTEQEHLLVRMATRGNPQELRSLDPSLRAEVAAADHASFDRFFPRPAPAPAFPRAVLPSLVPPPPSLPSLQPPPLTPPIPEGASR